MLIKCMQNYANFPGVFECNTLKVFEFFIATTQLVFFLYNEILFFFHMNIIIEALED